MTVSEIIVETHINQTPRDDYLSPRNTSKHFSMHNNIIYHIKTYKTKKTIKQNNHFARKYVWSFPPNFLDIACIKERQGLEGKPRLLLNSAHDWH